MNKILIVGISLLAVAVTGGANAADLPAYSKAPKAVPYDWTGFYLGGEFGFGWGNAQQSDATGFNSGSYTPNGAFAGGTIGYNWQTTNWVFGLEGDAAWADIGATTTGSDQLSTTHGSGGSLGCGGFTPACQAKLQDIDTIRGRVGYAFGYVMPYVTAGLAVGELHGQEGDVAANGAFGSGTTWVTGYAVGVGIESMILPRWTVKLEGMYTDFGKHTVFDDNIGGAIVPESIHFAPGWVKIGVNYKLW